MGRSLFRCKAPGCPGLLGAVDRYSKEFRPAQHVTAIAHGPSITLVCPVCGAPRVFSGWTMRIRPPGVV